MTQNRWSDLPARNFSGGMSRRIRRWANVKPEWAEFIATHTACEVCGIETVRPTDGAEQPNDRIYERKTPGDKVENTEFTPDDVRTVCRTHKRKD